VCFVKRILNVPLSFPFLSIAILHIDWKTIIKCVTSAEYPHQLFLSLFTPITLAPWPRFHARHLSLNNRYPQVIKSEVSLHQQSLSIGSTRAAYNILTLLTPSKQWMTKTPNTAWVTLFCSDVYKIFIKTLTFPWHGKMVTSVALTHKCAWYVAKVNCDKKDLVRQNQPVD